MVSASGTKVGFVRKRATSRKSRPESPKKARISLTSSSAVFEHPKAAIDLLFVASLLDQVYIRGVVIDDQNDRTDISTVGKLMHGEE